MKERFFTREWMSFYGIFVLIGLLRSVSFADETDITAFAVVTALFIFSSIALALMLASARKVNGRLWAFSHTAFVSSIVAATMMLLVFIAGGAIVLAGSVVISVIFLLFYLGSGLVLSVLTE